MRPTLDRAKEYVDAWNAVEGLRATYDPRDVFPPCVLISPPELVPGTMCDGEFFLKWTARLITPTVPGGDVWTTIDLLIGDVLGVIEDLGGGFTSAAPDQLILGVVNPRYGGDPMPCYTIQWEDAL